MRRTDSQREARFWYAARFAKAMVGLVFAAAAMWVAVEHAGAMDRLTYGVVVGTFALLAGLMFDAPGVTRLLGMVLDALPWTADRPEGESDG